VLTYGPWKLEAQGSQSVQFGEPPPFSLFNVFSIGFWRVQKGILMSQNHNYE
jgi:hypothetical protein